MWYDFSADKNERSDFLNIQGLQKLTLLDFPGRMACTLFTAGCDLRCPFCHNSRLVIHPPKETEYSEEDILSFFEKRKGILDGVAITGGEPLMQPDIFEFIMKIREKGYRIKLDTNGTFPDKLKKIVDAGLVDYVAMDVKASKANYPPAVGIGGYDISKVDESIHYLLENHVDYEFRTTVVNEFHDNESIEELGKWIKGAKRHYIQAFKDSGELIGFGLTEVSKADMLGFRNIMLKYVDECELRGV